MLPGLAWQDAEQCTQEPCGPSSGQREVRIDLISHFRLQPRLESQQRSERDHGRVVGAQPGLGDKKFDSVFFAYRE